MEIKLVTSDDLIFYIFFSNQNCQYQIMPITTSSKLKKLVAYESNNRDHIVAIGINGNSYYTLVSVIDEITLNITNTQAIVHNDKMIKIKDTEYDFNTQLLYVLEENNIENTGNFETYTLVVDPNTQTPYSLKAIKAEKDYKINDIIAYSLGDKFMGIGINSNNFQGLFSKKVSNGLQHCNVERDLKTIILGQITDMNMMIYSPNSYTNNWFTDNFQGNNYSQIIECLSN